VSCPELVFEITTNTDTGMGIDTDKDMVERAVTDMTWTMSVCVSECMFTFTFSFIFTFRFILMFIFMFTSMLFMFIIMFEFGHAYFNGLLGNG
jgi:hypothetical protein